MLNIPWALMDFPMSSSRGWLCFRSSQSVFQDAKHHVTEHCLQLGSLYFLVNVQKQIWCHFVSQRLPSEVRDPGLKSLAFDPLTHCRGLPEVSIPLLKRDVHSRNLSQLLHFE